MRWLGGLVLALVCVSACRNGPTEAAKAADDKSAMPPRAPEAAAPTAAPDAAPDAMLADASFTADTAPPRPLLTFGMTRPIGATAAIFSAKQLNSYLSKQLGGEVTTQLYDDAAALGDALSTGSIDAAWLTPTAYVRASERASIKAVARLSRGGFTSYRSVIFTKATSKAVTLDDLRGKSMVWVAPGSASGRAYPRAHLKKLGKDPDTFFGKQIDALDHHDVCVSVSNGASEAGATLSDERPAGEKPIVDGCREAGLDATQFRIIERTSPIPNDVIAVRAELPELIEGRVREALLQMGGTDDGKVQLKEIFRADGFSGVTDADFAPVREVQMFLELK